MLPCEKASEMEKGPSWAAELALAAAASTEAEVVEGTGDDVSTEGTGVENEDDVDDDDGDDEVEAVESDVDVVDGRDEVEDSTDDEDDELTDAAVEALLVVLALVDADDGVVDEDATWASPDRPVVEAATMNGVPDPLATPILPPNGPNVIKSSSPVGPRLPFFSPASPVTLPTTDASVGVTHRLPLVARMPRRRMTRGSGSCAPPANGVVTAPGAWSSSAGTAVVEVAKAKSPSRTAWRHVEPTMAAGVLVDGTARGVGQRLRGEDDDYERHRNRRPASWSARGGGWGG